MASVLISMVWGFVLAVTCTDGYSTGAPPIACESMFPKGHGVPAQKTLAPYRITVNPTNYMPSQTLTVTLSGENTQTHKGAFLQARRLISNGTVSNETVGTFSLDQTSSVSTYMLLSCGDIQNSAVTQKSNASKTTLMAKWIAPKQDVGPIVFRATVVETKIMFWVDVSSAAVDFNADVVPPVPVNPGGTTPVFDQTTAGAAQPECFRGSLIIVIFLSLLSSLP